MSCRSAEVQRHNGRKGVNARDRESCKKIQLSFLFNKISLSFIEKTSSGATQTKSIKYL